MSETLYPSLISVEEKIALYRLEKAAFFTKNNALIDLSTTHLSKSEKYELIVTPYKTKKGSVNYTLGTVNKVLSQTDKQVITTVQRNYSSFPYVFVEDHPNGHDYLICGEDYQGQTIIELDTGEKKSWLPAMGGFCWINMTPSPSKTLLAVEGCYWGCPHKTIIFDFSKPLDIPFDSFTEDFDIEEFDGWNDDDSCNIEIEFDTRKSDGKPIFELSKKELDILNQELEPGTNQNEIFEYDKKKIIWQKP